MNILSHGVYFNRCISNSCIYSLSLISRKANLLLYDKYLINKSKSFSTFSNVSTCSDTPLNSLYSEDKSFNNLTKYQFYYQTKEILKRLKYNEFDKFQNDIFTWVKSCYTKSHYLTNKLNDFDQNTNKFYDTSHSKVSLVVGGSNSGKTSSYLLSLSDVVNDPGNESSMINRDNYRSKMMVYGNLRGYKAFYLPNSKKINGIPKFNWNSYIVPASIILVPFRELGMNIFDFCSKINIRSRLLAGGKGYKKQTQGTTDLNSTNLASTNNGNFANNCRDNVDVVIATPEMFYRSLNGGLDDVKIDIKFVKLLVFEEADLLNEAEYLEKINEIINLMYSNRLNLLYVSRFKTDAMLNNLEQFMLVNNDSDTCGTGSCNKVYVVEKEVDNLDSVKKIFIHTSNNDRLELLIDLLHELNLPSTTTSAYNKSELTHRSRNNPTVAPYADNNSQIYGNTMNRNKTVIYCKNQKCNIFLKYSLLDRGFNAINLFGGMCYDERTNNLKTFQSGSNILITTNFTARYKLDCTINQVVLFDFPKNLNDYIHCISSLSGNDKRIYAFFNNKNLSLVKEIQAHSKSFSKFEFRNLTPKLSKKLHSHQSLIMKQLKTSGVKAPKKRSKLMAKKGKLVNNTRVLGPRKRKIMKKYYLMTRAEKNLQFLRKRGILRKNQLLPRTPDKHVEESDSQEFIQMKRSPDGFLQIIPRRRSRIRTPQEKNEYDKESLIIPGAPTYESELDKHSTHF